MLFVAGERCDVETLEWAKKSFGVPVLDHWWQTGRKTETRYILFLKFVVAFSRNNQNLRNMTKQFFKHVSMFVMLKKVESLALCFFLSIVS